MSSKNTIETFSFKNGSEFPLIGLGTFRADDEILFINAIKTAIKCGYRHFDCAWLYNNEKIIGNTLKEVFAESNGQLKREDFFLVSKVWNTFHSKDLVRKCLNETLKNLQVDYIDLYLIHWPMGFKENTEMGAFPKDSDGKMLYSEVNYLETYHALEELYKEGKIKNIGVSNFNIPQLKDILNNCEIKPMNNQIEVNPYLQNDKLIEFCQNNDICVSAYGPIGAGAQKTNRPDLPILLENEILKKIGKKYNKSVAQVILRWGIQRNLVMLPKSVTPSRIIENMTVFDFNLSEEDMNEIKTLNQNYRYYAVASLSSHPYYPFHQD